MPTQEQTGRNKAVTLDALREAMVESIGRRTIGQTDCLTAIYLNLFRRFIPPLSSPAGLYAESRSPTS